MLVCIDEKLERAMRSLGPSSRTDFRSLQALQGGADVRSFLRTLVNRTAADLRDTLLRGV